MRSEHVSVSAKSRTPSLFFQMQDSIYPEGTCPVLVSLAPTSSGSGGQRIRFDLSESVIPRVGLCCPSSEDADSRTSPIASQSRSRRLQPQVGGIARRVEADVINGSPEKTNK